MAMMTLESSATASSSPSSSSDMKCRYKTGKCSHVRSAKRNGEMHQLCVYHRDKANQIQRKFDRQKRQEARLQKSKSAMTMVGPNSPSAMEAINRTRRASFNPSDAPATPMTARADVEMYSDSDSSRFSTDSEASTVLDQMWQDLSHSNGVQSCDADADMVSPMHSPCSSPSQLSYDEIDFLCSAMLEG